MLFSFFGITMSNAPILFEMTDERSSPTDSFDQTDQPKTTKIDLLTIL